MFTLYDGRNELYQWDLNRKIIIEDPTISQVHFCNKTDDCSLVVIPYRLEDNTYVADIPNILLQDTWNIRAYAYCTDYTKVEETFKIKPRTKPADYVYTPTEILNWDAMQHQMDTLAPIYLDFTRLVTPSEVKDATEEENNIFDRLWKNPQRPLIFIKYKDTYVQSDIEFMHDTGYDKYINFYLDLYRHDLADEKQSITSYVYNAKYWNNKWEVSLVDNPTVQIVDTTYVDKAIEDVVVGEIDLSNYYTKEDTDNKIAEVVNSIPSVDLSNYYTKEETDTAIITSKDSYYLDFSDATNENKDATPDMVEFATRLLANENVCAHVMDASWSQVYRPVSIVKQGTNLVQMVQSDFNANSVDKAFTYNYYNLVRGFNNKWKYSRYFTKEVTLTSKEYVDNAIAGVEAGDVNLTNYYTKEEVDKAISEINVSIPDEYITETELNDKGYLTEHQSLEGYAKTTDIPDVSAYQTAEQVNALINTALSGIATAEGGSY